MAKHAEVRCTFSRRILPLYILLLGVGFSTQASNTADAPASVSRLTLIFAKPQSQASLGAAYKAALHNLLDVNTVPYQAATYNQTGLLTPPAKFIRAGGGYAQPWTRDASVNSWNAGSVLEPDIARNTLWAVVKRQADGKLIVQQDEQWWDQVIWITAAWNHYLVTGDKKFLADAYQTAIATLGVLQKDRFNAEQGLFEGPSFFNDGIAGYPVPPANASEDRGSFVLKYPGADKIMALSTNCVYYAAFRDAAHMARALGKSDETTELERSAASLKEKINETFWMPGRGSYGYLLHPRQHSAGGLDPSEEGAGLAFAILFGIADEEQTTSILRSTHVQPHGITDVYPNFTRYSDVKPGRHNAIVWPMVQGLWADAAAKAADEKVFSREVQSLVGLVQASGGHFYEIYNAQTGVPDGGWQTQTHWDSQPDQTWSATAYLRMIYSGLFGMNYTESSLQFRPLLPADWGTVSLDGFPYRDAILNIKLQGAGRVIKSFKVDGVIQAQREIPSTLKGQHVVEIILSAGP